MARTSSKHPTELELEILKLLWEHGGLSGQELRDHLADHRELTYASVMTVLGIMVDKGYAARRKTAGRYVYSASIREANTVKRMLRDLVDRAFHGSASAAAVQLIESGDVPQEELQALRTLIDRKTKEQS